MKDSFKKVAQKLSHAYKAQMQAKSNDLMFNVQICLTNKKASKQFLQISSSWLPLQWGERDSDKEGI